MYSTAMYSTNVFGVPTWQRSCHVCLRSASLGTCWKVLVLAPKPLWQAALHRYVASQRSRQAQPSASPWAKTHVAKRNNVPPGAWTARLQLRFHLANFSFPTYKLDTAQQRRMDWCVVIHLDVLLEDVLPLPPPHGVGTLWGGYVKEIRTKAFGYLL